MFLLTELADAEVIQVSLEFVTVHLLVRTERVLGSDRADYEFASHQDGHGHVVRVPTGRVFLRID